MSKILSYRVSDKFCASSSPIFDKVLLKLGDAWVGVFPSLLVMEILHSGMTNGFLWESFEI